MNQYMKKITAYFLMTLLAFVICEPVTAGQWVVDHYLANGESLGETGDDPFDPFMDPYWGTHKWTSPYYPHQFIPVPQYGAEGYWTGGSNTASSVNTSKIYATGSFTPVFRWVPNPYEESTDLPPSKLYARIHAEASATLTTNNLSEFEAWDYDVQAGGEDVKTEFQAEGQYWYLQKRKNASYSAVITIDNKGRSTLVRSPTTHKLHAKSVSPGDPSRQSHHNGYLSVAVRFSATPLADIKINSSIEDSTKKIDDSGIPFPNVRDHDGNIAVDTVVDFKIVDSGFDEMTHVQDTIKKAWTFNGQFAANPFPAGATLGFTNPQYTWNYVGPPLTGYVQDSLSTSVPDIEQSNDPSKANMNVYIGDLRTYSPYDFSSTPYGELDPEFLRQKFGANFPVKGTVYVTVADANDPTMPVLSKKMDVTWHLPVDVQSIKKRPPLNDVHPSRITSITPAEWIETTNPGASNPKPGATPLNYAGRYILHPNPYFALSHLTGVQWLEIGLVSTGTIYAAGKIVIKLRGVGAAGVTQFLGNNLGGAIASGLTSVGIFIASTQGEYNATQTVVNDYDRFFAAYMSTPSRVNGIYTLHPNILATIDKPYADNDVWNGCAMKVNVKADSTYELFTGDGYGYRGYTGPEYLHTYKPLEPEMLVSYDFVSDPPSY